MKTRCTVAHCHSLFSLIQALHKYVTKAGAVAEACHKQRRQQAIVFETELVVVVMEALRRAGIQALAEEDSLRHFYVMRGLAACNMVSIFCVETIKFPFTWDIANTCIHSFPYP